MTAPAAAAPASLPAMPARPSFLEGALAAALTPEGLMLLGPLCMTLALGRGVTRWTGLDGLLAGGIALAVLGVLALVLLARRGGAATAMRTVHGHTSSRAAAAVHEAGHAAVARYIGGSDITARISSDGSGWTSYRPPAHMPPSESIAVSLAGAIGEGVGIDSPQCRGDAASIARDLRHVGWLSRGSTMRRAEEIAAAGLAQQSGYADRTAKQLSRSGRSR